MLDEIDVYLFAESNVNLLSFSQCLTNEISNT